VGTSKIGGGEGFKGSHNKPTGCGASGAYAPGPDDKVVVYFLKKKIYCVFI
jgi:hypothetical protein